MPSSLAKERAWIEVNLAHLEDNVHAIQKVISPSTKIMAVVKADAYGHGSIEVSKYLNRLGIEDFAVATLEEGILLRENHIKGNILILGYTSPQNLRLVVEYDLIQTAVDKEYATRILHVPLKRKLKVYLKINTGMNRLGISYDDVDFIKEIYKKQEIDVVGMYSHFCVADSKEKENIEFSNLQQTRFNTLVKTLKTSGYNVGKVHMQSSYGILNYNENGSYDYVRPGIILYGVHSDTNAYVKRQIDLKPVLSLKAKITSIKEIEAGETVSYGRTYQASKQEKIASVSIGYADGYPREISNKGAKVVVNNQYAEIIGRICMDQLVINVTNISEIKVGDIVTLIGNTPFITAEEVAEKAGSITNELLCRLGTRLHKVYINKREEL